MISGELCVVGGGFIGGPGGGSSIFGSGGGCFCITRRCSINRLFSSSSPRDTPLAATCETDTEAFATGSGGDPVVTSSGGDPEALAGGTALAFVRKGLRSLSAQTSTHSPCGISFPPTTLIANLPVGPRLRGLALPLTWILSVFRRSPATILFLFNVSDFLMA